MSGNAAFQVGTAFMVATNTASTTVMGQFNFGGVSGNSWDDFCETITGSAGLCDGTDNEGSGGGASDFLFASTYNTLSAATSSPIWAQTGLFASSTSYFVNANASILTLLGSTTNAFFQHDNTPNVNQVKLTSTAGTTSLMLVSTKNGNWVDEDIKGAIEFYGSDASGSGAGKHAYIRAQAEGTAGVSTNLTFGTVNGGGNGIDAFKLEHDGDAIFPHSRLAT
jgi:hypothetical protein